MRNREATGRIGK
jgi:ribonuclease HI